MDVHKQSLLPFLVLLVGALHGCLFLAGYRLSADDVAYHLYAMEGVSDSWQFVKSAAIGQGRIVHFPDLVTSLIGAYFADEYLFRVFYVSLFFSNFVLVGYYFTRLSGTNAGWFATLILFSFHPLDYFHLSPNAYPFKISFPVFLLLVSRIALIKIRGGKREGVGRHENYWIALSFAAMMFSEYAFSFACSLIFAEFIARLIARRAQEVSWIDSAWRSVREQYFLKDLCSIVLFLSIYIAFRQIFPSAYEGNQLPTKFELHSFLKTLVGHIYGGTTFSSWSRYHALNTSYLKSLDIRGWLLVSLMFCGTFVSAGMALNAVVKEKAPSKAQVRYSVAAGVALLSALLVTAPVAITTKYQGWCKRVDSCAFLDSSLSYLGFGIFLAALLIAFAHSLLALRIPQKWIVGFASLAVAFGASFSHLNNLRMEADMRRYVSGWERAKKMVCKPDKVLLEFAPTISTIVEPSRRISFHPWFETSRYWLTYIADQKNGRGCTDTSATLSDLYPIEFDKKMSTAASGPGLAYLSYGWSKPEAWGTWSEESTAEIILSVDRAPHEIVIEASALVAATHPVQNVAIEINNVLVANRQLTAPSHNEIKIAITDNIRGSITKTGVIRMQLQFPNAISPQELGMSADPRSLSLGIISVTVN